MKYFDGLMAEWVEETAEKYPDNTAYEFLGRKVSYKKLVENIHTCARGLIRIGVKEGDRVAIVMPNTPQAVVFMYAVNKIGAVSNLIHPLSSKDDLLRYFTLVEARHLLVFDRIFPLAADICRKTMIENIVVADIREELSPFKGFFYSLSQKKSEKAGGSVSVSGVNVVKDHDFMREAEKNGCDTDLPVIRNRRDEMAVILYSGGTTGKTKGICLSNYAVNGCAAQLIDRFDIRPGDSVLSVMPMFHGYGLVGGMHCFLVNGGKSVIVPRFSPEICVRELCRHKCNYITGSPTLFEKMMHCDLWKGRDLSFLKCIASGSDSLSIKLEKQLDEFFASLGASVYVRQGYGMTECVFTCCCARADRKKPGSIGTALEGVSMKIVEPGTENELPAGETGEIVFSSVTNMMGYYNDPAGTAEVMKKHSDGKVWIHSKDLGYMDEDGNVFFKGRIKRIIVTSGYNVLPLELEEQIDRCELVEKSCVKGVKDDVRVERVKAFIKLKPGVEKNDETRDRITDYCREHIARYAVPREIEFVDSFPLTKIGKIDYRKL